MTATRPHAGRRLRRRRLSRAAGRAAIARLAALIGGGIPVSDAVEVGAAGGGPAGRVIARLARAVQRGHRFSQALARSAPWLSAADVALVAAGEQAGDLGRGVALLDARLEQRARARASLTRALAYPAGLLALTLAVATGMAAFVLPGFAVMYRGAGLGVPRTTRLVMDAGAALTRYGPTVSGAIPLSIAVVVWLRRQSRGLTYRLDQLTLRLPVAGPLVFVSQKSALYATLAALLDAGVDVDTALAHAAHAVSNAALRHTVERARMLIAKGHAPSAAIARSGLDPGGGDSALVRIAESTGDYGACFSRLAVAAAATRDERLQRITRMIEPLTMMIMALIVGATALGLYQPVLGAGALLQGGAP